MATSSTLKALKEQDGPGDSLGLPARIRPTSRSGRLETWWRSIWRRRWLSLATAWAICLAGWAVITLWPTSYIASAVIYADPAELADEGPAAEEPAALPLALLKSRLLSEDGLEKVRETVALDPARSRALAADIMLRSTVPPVFVLTYEHPDPDAAKQVLDVLIAAYRARLEGQAAAAVEAAVALDRQIADHRRQLRTIDGDLAAFRRANADFLGGSGDKAAELALLEETIDALGSQLESTIADRDSIAAKLAEAREPQSDGDDQPSRTPDQLEIERRALNTELAKLRQRYADSHPYVVAVLEAIRALEIEAEALQAAAAAPVSPDAAPLDRDALEQRHGELIVDVSTLNAELGEKRREIEHLQALTRTATSVEAELSELEAEKEQLVSALSDLQQSRGELGDVDGGEATNEAFRLIKQPELPTDPVGPSRLMALAAVLIGGTGLGAAVAVFCNRMKGVFESAWQLRQRFDVGVLGTISEVMTPAERKRLGHKRLAFGLACLALIGLFGGLVAAELTDSLAPLGDRLRSRLLG